MSLSAGERNQRVTLLTPSFTTNALNEKVEGSPTSVTVWAKVIEGDGREYVAAGRQTAEKRITVLLLKVGRTIDSRAKVVWNGRTYEIEDVSRLAEDGLQLMCKSIETDVNR